MINYSIVKRSVNANLIEINQAKSRINQAKKEGKTPQPADLALVKTEKQNALKGQKPLAQGNALGYMFANLSPCKVGCSKSINFSTRFLRRNTS